jgi:hypothetical protein
MKRSGIGSWDQPRLASKTLSSRGKNVTIKRLPCLASLLYLVCAQGQLTYYLLLTGIHN